MRRSDVFGIVAVGVAATMVVAGCTSSGTKGTTKPSGTTSPSASASSSSNTNSGGTPVTGGTLHMLGVGDVDYMDPNITYYTTGYLAARMYSRQWITYPAVQGQTTTDVPDIATQLPTTANGGIAANGLSYTLTIKSGVDWNTTPARQVTGADFVRGLKRTCNPAQPFGGLPDYEGLIVGFANFCAGFAKVNPKSASAIAAYENTHNFAGISVDPSNPLTVTYKLTQPASYFLAELALPAFSPAPVEYDQYIPASLTLAQHTISDGPYEIQSYNPTKSITFVRNPAWKASTDQVRKAYVNEIDVNETGSQEAIQEQLAANTTGADMEWDTFPSVTDVPQLVQKKDPNLQISPTYSSNPYLIFNTISPNNNKALQNVAVRQALSEAMNRAEMTVQIGGAALNPPLTHILPAGISGTVSNTSPSYYPYSVSAAKAALAKAGASKMTLKFLYRPASSIGKALFTTIQQQLAQVGVKVTGVAVPNSDFYTKYLEVPSVAAKGTWDLSLAGWGPDWYGDAADSYFAPLFYGNDGKAGSAYPPNGSDFGFYNDPAVNAGILKAAAATDPTTSAALWASVDAQVMKDAAIFPITADNQATYHATHTKNDVYVPALQQIDPTNVWLATS
jgi:peptide/nickel transport system substrate-binding protein